MQPTNDKNEPSRFLGEGVCFKAKLIGILEVSEARGDRMCQEALSDLKMAIRAAGEHKQRITIHVAIDGLRLRDEKTGDSLYHHPVHKISFIAQDMSDSRAFGYIFGSPDTGHRFFGIKTDKAASQVVIAMRDLFQVVFELKKKEIELAKQHIEQKSRFGGSASSSLFSDSVLSSSKLGDSHAAKMTVISESGSGTSKSPTDRRTTGASGGPAPEAIADLVDLELELSSIQQGIHQMERITPSDPFAPNKDDPFGTDPFGDSFTSFPQKPYLPPPPSSSRDRSSRTASSDSSNLFSPRSTSTAPPLVTPATTDTTTRLESTMFDSPADEQNDWFATPPQSALFMNEDTSLKKDKDVSADQPNSQETKKSIMEQFDVFTELDPLGTGRSKPYIDKKLFFQELKNPPKKVLKDMVGTTSIGPSPPAPSAEQPLFTATFESNKTDRSCFNSSNFQSIDPFADEDPFEKADPFAEPEFKPPPQDPFNTDFVVDFKMYGKEELKPIQKSPLTIKPSDNGKDLIDSLKFPPVENILDDSLSSLYTPMSKSPNRPSILEKQFSLASSKLTSSPKSLFLKQNTFDAKFDFHDKRIDSSSPKLSLLHENPSLDMSSESESVPEPPPRPTTNITPIKPPPLPPKKQPGEMPLKPPPRPPHTDEISHYDYIEHYESGPNSLDSIDKSPPLPVPARRARPEKSSAFTQRMQRPFNVQSSDEDYLTPVAPPLLPPQKKDSSGKKSPRDPPILLPPPQKKDTPKKKTERQTTPITSLFDSKPGPIFVAEKPSSPKPNITDMTLTDLTRSGLDELAQKLNVPASQLANMTLVQLTDFLQNHLEKNKPKDTTCDISFPAFKAEFSMNFSDIDDGVSKTNSQLYDRYAVFRELIEKEESREPEILKEPIETKSDLPEVTNITSDLNSLSLNDTMNDEIPVKDTDTSVITPADRYAALREIIVEDLVQTEEKEINIEDPEEKVEVDKDDDTDKQQNDLNVENNRTQETNVHELDLFNCIDTSTIFNKEKSPSKDSNIIEYSKQIVFEVVDRPVKEINKPENDKSPPPIRKSPITKSPIPVAITEIIQSNNHLTSGSLSDVISGSSPEIDNVRGSPEVIKKNETTTESWAIFDTTNFQPAVKEKQPVQSEEGVSPWSSDSKEFVTASPTDWRQRKDSGSGDEQWTRRMPRSKEHEVGEWWDTGPKSREIRDQRDKPTRDERERHRRSTDSYEDECYEMDRGYRERRVRQTSWSRGHQSSSSRDVSPWEEEPCRDWGRRRGPPSRRSRDSWDEEDDYEYDADRPERWSERRAGSRERYSGGRRSGLDESWGTSEDRRHGPRRRHRTPAETDHHCCGDWEQDSDTGYMNEKVPIRCSSGRYSQEAWWERDRKWDDDRYYGRNRSQESPWEDDYCNDPDDGHPSRYLTAKRGWKRPSSASETDRTKSQYHVPVAGSDGERDRRYKQARRARSRDSQFSEDKYRHKPDPGLTLRYPHRSRDKPMKSPFEDDFSEQSIDTPSPKTKYDFTSGKSEPSVNKKFVSTSKTKDMSPKSDIESPQSSKTLPMRPKQQYPQNEFDSGSPVSGKFDKFKFDSEFSEVDSPVISSMKKTGPKQLGFDDKPEKEDGSQAKGLRQNSMFENDFFDNDFRTKRAPRQFENNFSNIDRDSPTSNKNIKPKLNLRQESQFEDDFSPTEKPSSGVIGETMADIDEETVSGSINDQIERKNVDFSFPKNNLDKPMNSILESKRQNKIALGKRLSGGLRSELNLKKSESVNIFARESDPFEDDDFFSRPEIESMAEERNVPSPRNVESLQWAEDFDCFDAVKEDK